MKNIRLLKCVKKLPMILAFMIIIYIGYSIYVGGFKLGNNYAIIFNNSEPDIFLSQKHYKYSYYITDTTICVVILNNHLANFTDFKVNNNGQINISLKQDDKLIISFPNRGTPCRYFIDNLSDINILKYKNDTIIPTANISTDGSIYQRQNMYIDTIKQGKQRLIIKLMDSQGNTNVFTDFDQIYINVNIEK